MDRITRKCNTEALTPFIAEGMGLTEEQFMRRCRAVAISDALQKTVEGIGHDKHCHDTNVTENLLVAKDALLDALSELASSELAAGERA
jgi:hypothetical protein